MTRQIKVGKVLVGGGAPVSIQSMCNTRTTDVEGSLRQLKGPGRKSRLPPPISPLPRILCGSSWRRRKQIRTRTPMKRRLELEWVCSFAFPFGEGGSQRLTDEVGN